VPADKTLHQIAFVEQRVAGKTVHQRKSKGRVIGPATGFQPEGAAAHHVGKPGMAVACGKFQRGAHRVADIKPQHGAEGPVALRRIGCVRPGLWHGENAPHMLLLRPCFDSAGTHLAHCVNGGLGFPAQFHQQTRGNRACPPKSAPAMQQHIGSAAQQGTDVFAEGLPCGLESIIGCRDVHDGQINP